MRATARSIGRALALATVLVSGADQLHAACSITTNPLAVIQINPLALGTFIRPFAGDGTVTVAANGSSTIPSNLNPISSNPLSPNATKQLALSRQPRAATVLITGGGGCAFKIEVESSSTADLFGVTFLPASGYTLSSTGSGAQGTLAASGSFTFTVGAQQRVSSSSGQTIGGTIRLLVTYI